MVANKKVVKIAELKAKFKEAGGGVEELPPGSSDRINEMIDLYAEYSGYPIPPRGKKTGRASYIVQLSDVSYPTVVDWLERDKLPRDTSKDKTSLHQLVSYFTKDIPGKYDPFYIISWIRYGEDTFPNPFSHLKKNNNVEKLMPVAASIVVEIASEKAIQVPSFDLEKVLDETGQILDAFKIAELSEISPPIRLVIEQIIIRNLL